MNTRITGKFGTALAFYLGGSKEHEVEYIVEYSVLLATRDYYDKSMGAWYPGDPAEVAILSIKRADTGEALPGWMFDILVDDGLLQEQIMDEATDKAAADYEAAMEARAER